MNQDDREYWHDPGYWRDKYAPKKHSAAYWRMKYAPEQHSSFYWKYRYGRKMKNLRNFLHGAEKVVGRILYYAAWGLCLYRWYQYFAGR